MHKHIVIVAVFVIVSLTSVTQAAHGSYGGMPGPTTRQLVARVAGNNLELWGTVSKPVYETRVRKETFQVGDKSEERDVTYTVVRQVFEMHVRTAELGKVKAYGADRKPIKQQQLARRLHEAQPVLVVEHDAKIDAHYLKLVRDDTIFLVLPPPPIVTPTPDIAPPTPDIVPPPAKPEAPAPREPRAEPPTLPGGQQPTVALASLNSGGGLRIRRSAIFTFETTGMTFEGEGETARQVPAAIKQTERSETIQEFKAENVRAFTATGDEVPADDLTERLAKEQVVLVSADGKSVDAGYLKIIRDDALVLVVPAVQPWAEPGVGPGGMVPVAPPAVAPPPM